MSVVERVAGNWTAADLAAHLGDIPLSRIRFDPAPGTATEQDVLDIHAREKRLCELVDGVLVEKTMGFKESVVAGALLALLRAFVVPRRLGVVAGPDGMMRLARGLVRIPDVSFVSRQRLPGGKIPTEPIPDLVPDLAAEVLSPSNTRDEMSEKLKDYFKSGVRLVWYADPDTRTIDVFTPDGTRRVLTASDTLTGGEVLPGFEAKVAQVFADLDG